MFEEIKEQYKFIANYFSALLENDKFDIPNSIILYGSDILAQYYIAMLIAKNANCSGEKNSECNCQNCCWIKKNEHPEVITISKIDSKPDNDDSKTVISVKQTDMIKDKLVISSEYHRFFIFCDAEDKILNESEKEKIQQFEHIGITLPKTAKNEWYPKGINKKCFSDVVANSLLKSIEEPPSKVTFVFLTDDPENIISTIVSRSQAFFVPGFLDTKYDLTQISKIFEKYPDFDLTQELSLSDKIVNLSLENEQNLINTINGIQIYLAEFLKKNTNNLILSKKIKNDIEKLHNIESMLKSNVKDQIAADETGYIFTQKVNIL